MEGATNDGGPRPDSSRRAGSCALQSATLPRRATRLEPSPALLLLHVALCGLLACAPVREAVSYTHLTLPTKA